ncbi:hypothetical protein CMI40_00175 [Candidatus Pacearchaeota archaeon]|nr:hypothetical protein [Candidatus Pacearchaeota archaeon]|tara:strand:- start:6106 stop:6888 length:783 start_codon:yes stop_codon:yes gene_type:complete
MKTHDKILDVLEEKPMTASQIIRRLSKEGLGVDRSVIYRHLERAEKNKEVGRFDDPTPKGKGKGGVAKKIIEEGYGKIEGRLTRVNWSEESEKIWFRTKESEKLFKKLLRRYSNDCQNDDLINEIVDNYRSIEARAIYNKNQILEPELVKRQRKEDGKDYSPETVKTSINKAIFDCNRTYKNRYRLIKINFSNDDHSLEEEFKQFLSQIILDKWMTFFAILDIKSTQSKSMEEKMILPTNIVNDRMFKLFIRLKKFQKII